MAFHEIWLQLFLHFTKTFLNDSGYNNNQRRRQEGAAGVIAHMTS